MCTHSVIILPQKYLGKSGGNYHQLHQNLGFYR